MDALPALGGNDRVRRSRLEACATNLDLPTLLVRGGLPDLLSEAGAQAFLKLCPTPEYVNVSGAGHMVAGDRNDSFATATIEFLKRIVPADSKPIRSSRASSQIEDDRGKDIVDVP